MSTKSKILIHILFWMFWLNAIFWLYDYEWIEKADSISSYLIHYFQSYGAHAAVFYLLYFLLIPKFLFKGKITQFILYFLIVGASNMYFHAKIWDVLDENGILGIRNEEFVILTSWQMILLINSCGIWVWERWMSSEKNRLDLENEVKSTELLYLKSQMSPHFLFNTLNNMYSLSLNARQETSQAIGDLKSMMQYVAHFESGERVNLRTEIEYLQNYIALNQLRFPVKVNFKTEVEDEEFKIEPMLLLPFIENAFKHGDTSENGDIVISLTQRQKTIRFNITNDIAKQKRKDNVSGIGNNNIRKRIKLIYPFTSDLKIDVSEKKYFVKLSIS